MENTHYQASFRMLSKAVQIEIYRAYCHGNLLPGETRFGLPMRAHASNITMLTKSEFGDVDAIAHLRDGASVVLHARTHHTEVRKMRCVIGHWV